MTTIKKKTKTKTKAPRRQDVEAAPYKGARLAEARRVAREAMDKHPVGALSLRGVGLKMTPKNPKADIWAQDAGVVFIVRGNTDRGRSWIARHADHSEGFEGNVLFGRGAYTVARELMAPALVGFKDAGLTVTP